MPGLTGPIQGFQGVGTSEVSTSEKNLLGTIGYERGNPANVYLFVRFDTAVVAGEMVAIDQNFLATQLTSTSVGRVGVVQSAASSSNYGWVQIRGTSTIAAGTSGMTSAMIAFAPATTDHGHFDGAPAATTTAIKIIYGLIPRSAGSCTTTHTDLSRVTVQLIDPYVLPLAQKPALTT